MTALWGAIVFVAVVDQIDNGVASLEVLTPAGIEMWSMQTASLPVGTSEGQSLELRLRRVKRRPLNAAPLGVEGFPPDLTLRAVRSVKPRQKGKYHE